MKLPLVKILLAMLITPTLASAGANGSGGGDTCENNIQFVVNQLIKWIEVDQGHLGLDLPSGWDHEKYATQMLNELKTSQVRCVKEGNPGYPVQITDSATGYDFPKECRFDRIPGSYALITCDREAIETMGVSDELYQLIHHEHAGPIGLEPPNVAKSEYSSSNQIAAFTEWSSVKRLTVVKKIKNNSFYNIPFTEFGDLEEPYVGTIEVSSKEQIKKELQNYALEMSSLYINSFNQRVVDHKLKLNFSSDFACERKKHFEKYPQKTESKNYKKLKNLELEACVAQAYNQYGEFSVEVYLVKQPTEEAILLESLQKQGFYSEYSIRTPYGRTYFRVISKEVGVVLINGVNIINFHSLNGYSLTEKVVMTDGIKRILGVYCGHPVISTNESFPNDFKSNPKYDCRTFSTIATIENYYKEE